ncbi:MAG: aminopeptidase P family N-terminal domain-containing protein [Anaerolineae bacterium]
MSSADVLRSRAVLATETEFGAATAAPAALAADDGSVAAERLAALRADLAAHDLAAMAVMSHPNRRYLTGFGGSAGIAFVLPERALLFVDSRYYERGPSEAPACETLSAGYAQIEAVGTALSEAGIRRVAARGRPRHRGLAAWTSCARRRGTSSAGASSKARGAPARGGEERGRGGRRSPAAPPRLRTPAAWRTAWPRRAPA